MFEEGLALCRASDNKAVLGFIAGSLGEAYAYTGRLAEGLALLPAETRYQEALALGKELGMRPLQAHCRLGLGTLYSKIGRPEQARAELSAAIELYNAMEMRFWLPQAEAALSEIG